MTWPKVRIIENIVTGYPCGYAFACFKTDVDACAVLRNWLSETRKNTTGRHSHSEGLAIPGGEKVGPQGCSSVPTYRTAWWTPDD